GDGMVGAAPTSAPDGGESGWTEDEAAADAGSDTDSGAAQGSAGASSDLSPSAFERDRQIIRTAHATVEVDVDRAETREQTRQALADEARDTATAVRALATGAGGYVSSSEGSGATMTVTLRVP